LRGRGPADLRDLSIELSAWMFHLGERTKSVEEGRRLATQMLASGKALEKFRDCIRLQGGDARVLDDASLLPMAKKQVDVVSAKAGFIAATHCREFGVALAMLEGGRGKKEDRIDLGVGLEFHKRIGDRVHSGEKLVTIQYNSDTRLAEAKDLIASSFIILDNAPPVPPLIRRVIGA